MSDWTNTADGSDRIASRFAWLPVRTFDAGWIWLRRYWLHEHIYGWGFHDKLPYLWRAA